MATISSGTNPLLIGIIIVLLAAGAIMYNTAPVSTTGGVDNDTTTLFSTVSTTTPAVAVDLKLDSEFISLATTDNDSAVVTIADVDSINFDSDKSKITLQLDAEIDTTTSAGNTTFSLKARNDTGVSVTLTSSTETGTLTAPTTDLTKTMTFTFKETLTSGFSTTEQVSTHEVLASADMLKGTPADSAKLFSPIVVQALDTNKPEIKIDTTKDLHSYLWTATTTPKTISVTFDISFINVGYLTEISESQPITITAIGSDDAPYTIEILKNTAI